MRVAAITDRSSAILVDVTRCTGCERCVAACVDTNGLDPVAADHDGAVAFGGLSANRLCTITPLGDGRWARKSCMHCVEPACVAACLVGALRKTPEGAVIYDSEKCIGCRYCMLACPMHIPRYEWDKPIPFVAKCDMCHDRFLQGRVPACVEACPHQALTFGERGEMLRQARERILGEPSRYLPHIWGEHEWGGTSVLYLSDIDLGDLDLEPLVTRSVPSITDPVIHLTPAIAFGVATTMFGLAWILQRRQDLMKREDEANGGEDD